MHTGQPGPMMTLRPRGNTARSPNLAIACSWLPQTCITDTGTRPTCAVVRTSASASAFARTGSRNSSCPVILLVAPSAHTSDFRLSARLHLPTHIGHHQIVVRAFPQQLFVQSERAFHIRRRHPTNGEADMIENVVANRDRLVNE